MRSLYTVRALVAVCSVAVLAQSALLSSDYGSGSEYATAPAISADPYDGSGSEYTPAPTASADLDETPAPVAQDVSTPYTEETPAPVIEETPYPAASADPYETPASAVLNDGSGSEYTPAATTSVDPYETPAPVAQDVSTPLVEEIPVPMAEEASGDVPSYYHRAHRRQRQVDNTTDGSTTTTKARPVSTTTTPRPGSTTTARPGNNATEESASNSTEEFGNATATCTGAAACFHDDECGSTGDKKGRCLGVFNGKCNCNACINFLSCKDDSACGGLKGACNTTTSRCSCEEGFKVNGFASFLDTLREFCNVKDCNADNSDEQCFGLPCHSGRCVC